MRLHSFIRDRIGKLVKRETWVLTPESSTFAPSGYYSNKDMDPVPEDQRTWSTMNYVLYWVSDAANIPTWELASSMLAIGLSWRQALPAIAIGNTLLAGLTVLNGTVGARLHVPFPVLNRSSFGFWFSYFSVISRVVLSMFWFGIHMYAGSECVYQMLKAIWPSIAYIPNQLPKGANITTSGMLCYILYWLILFPFMFVSPQKLRYLFMAKGILVPISWIAMLIWALVKAPSIGSVPRKDKLNGNSLSWAWIIALNNSLGRFSALTVNISDFTRYAKDERAQYVQVIIIPIAVTFCNFIGIAVTNAGHQLYGEILWDPLKLIDKWDNRAAAFFAAFSFCLAAIGANISTNTLSAGNDMTALWPKYINIRRGQIICAIIGGWALCPWEILASASGFLTFISGYSIVVVPIAGIMITDYWLVHRGKVDVPSMYNPHGRYHYSYGVNWRAALSLLVSVPPNIPELINSINPKVKVGSIAHIFDLYCIFGFFTASVVYYATSIAFPARRTFIEKEILSAATSDDSIGVEQIVGDTDLEKRSSGGGVESRKT